MRHVNFILRVFILQFYLRSSQINAVDWEVQATIPSSNSRCWSCGSIRSPVESAQEGERMRADPVLFHTALETERPWRLWCTWRVWAGPRSTRETHNVSFVLNDCAVGTSLPLSSCCLLSAVKCGNDFCHWTSARSLWGGMSFPPLAFLSPCPYLRFAIFQCLHLIRCSDLVESAGTLWLRCGVWIEDEVRGEMHASRGIKGRRFKPVWKGRRDLETWWREFLHTLELIFMLRYLVLILHCWVWKTPTVSRHAQSLWRYSQLCAFVEN